MFLQPGQFFDDRGRDQVGARAQDLAEFDERGPEVFQGPAESSGAGLVMFRDVPLAEDHAAAPPQVAIELELLHDVAKTVLQEDGGDLAAAAEVAEESKRMRFRKHGFSHPAENNGEP